MAGSEDEGVVETPKNGDERIPETEEPMELEAAGDAQGAADDLKEVEIDAKVAAAKKEQGELVSQIRMQKKLRVPCDLERENLCFREMNCPGWPRIRRWMEPALCPGGYGSWARRWS